MTSSTEIRLKSRPRGMPAPGDFEVDPLHRANASVADFETADFEQVHADCAVTATPRYASITFGSR